MDKLARALADRYTIERELGRGGMATVYLARDVRHDRPVALKVLHPELAATLGPERFQREIKLAARLQHPHILTVHDSGETEGQLWFTMPFIEGESLRDRLSREKQLSVDDAVRIAREAADALQYAHEHGVIHRDIKPENILLTSNHALVADFGIARALGEADRGLTGTGLAIGTPGYMSPEQASGERQLDARTDVFALGAVLYEMLAGQAPFTGPTAMAVVAKTLTDSPAPLTGVRASVPASVEKAVNRALAKVPADRFASAAQFAEALAGPGFARPSGAMPKQPETATHRGANRRSFAIFVVGLVIGLGALFAWRSSPSGRSAGGATGGVTRLAVLPFENQGDTTDAYFADGITDEIRGKLAKLPGLQVIASSSANQYKKTGKSPEQVADELGVQFLLVGKIRWDKSGGGQGRVRVSPELIEVLGGKAPTTRWQDGFDGALTDVFKVQADIAGQVAQALNVALGAPVQAQLAEKPTQNLAAYDAYLKGIEARNQGNAPAVLRRAAGYFDQAVAMDPGFMVAWAALSEATSLLNGVSVPTQALADKARAAAERAIQLAPDRADGHVAMGHFHRRLSRDQQLAIQEYRRGRQLAPSSAAVMYGLGLSEYGSGNLDSSLAHLEEAARLDPRSPNPPRELAILLGDLRRYDEALAASDRALALAQPDLGALERKVMVWLSQGNLAKAREVAAVTPKGVEPPAWVAYLATYQDLFWVLSDEQQSILLRLGPSEFDEDRGAWGLALAATHALRGNQQLARTYADSARVALEKQIADQPDDPQLHVLLGTALAMVGRKAEAVQEGRRGVERLSMTRDRANGAYMQLQLARIHILNGEADAALDQLELLLAARYYLTPGWLRIDPAFESLRKLPRFQRMVSAQ